MPVYTLLKYTNLKAVCLAILLIFSVGALQAVRAEAVRIDRSALMSSLDELDEMLEHRDKLLQKKHEAIKTLKRQAKEKS